jgi:hypothetical protein
MGEQLQTSTCMAVPVCCGRQGAAGVAMAHALRCSAALSSFSEQTQSIAQCPLGFINTSVCLMRLLISSTTTCLGALTVRSSCCCWCVYGLCTLQVLKAETKTIKCVYLLRTAGFSNAQGCPKSCWPKFGSWQTAREQVHWLGQQTKLLCIALRTSGSCMLLVQCCSRQQQCAERHSCAW